MNTPILLFYLGGICDRALAILIFLIVVSCILFIVFCILSCGTDPEFTAEENKACKTRFRRLLKWPVIAIFVLAAGTVFIPSSKTMYILSGIYASKYIVTETELGRTLNSEAVTVVKDIGKAIHKLASDDTDK